MRGAIERLGGIEVRRFLVDFSTLVAVALGQVFGFKRGLEGFGFGPVLVDLLAVFLHIFFAILWRKKCRANFKQLPPPLMGNGVRI